MDEQEGRQRLADHVIRRRTELRLSRRELADAAKLHERTIGEIERAKAVRPASLGAVEAVLQWEAGSWRRILNGGSAIVAEHQGSLDAPLQRIMDDPDLTDPEKRALVALGQAMRAGRQQRA